MPTDDALVNLIRHAVALTGCEQLTAKFMTNSGQS